MQRGTVRAALEAYLAHLRQQGRGTAASEIEGRYKAVVWPDQMAEAALESLMYDDFVAWRERLRAGRLNRSVNRQIRAVVADSIGRTDSAMSATRPPGGLSH